MINADDEDAKGAEEISAAAERFSLSRLAEHAKALPQTDQVRWFDALVNTASFYFATP